MKEHNFKKKFGQNFLSDKNMIKKIISLVDLKSDDLVIEIGAGSGELTNEIKNHSKVIAYEIDSDLDEHLKNRFSNENVEIIIDDFLKRDVKKDLEKYEYDNLYVIANLPYYITTPIINKLIEEKLNINKMVLMVQKEVGERFNANINSKDYSSITVFLNYYFDVKKEFIVSKNLFYPKPAIDSMIISLSQKNNRILAEDEELFLRLIRDSFRLKRKTLRNNLKEYNFSIIEKVLEKKNLPINVRGEQIPLEVFIEISNELKKK